MGRFGRHYFNRDVRDAVKLMKENGHTRFETLEEFHKAYREARLLLIAAKPYAVDIADTVEVDIIKEAKTLSIINSHNNFELGIKRAGQSNRADSDFASFQKRGWRASFTRIVKKIEGVSATNVIDASRQLLLAQLYLDEKLGRNGMGLSPDVLMKHNADILSKLDAAASHNPVKGDLRQAPTPSGDDTASAEMRSHAKSDLKKRIPHYQMFLPVDKQREQNINPLVRWYVNRKTINNGANPASDLVGNCNAGSASLLRLAAELNNKTLHVHAASSSGAGAGHEVYMWNPLRTKARVTQ